MRDLIPALARGLEPWLGGPFALFGHSLGALVGFELARHLRREHRLTPRRLFVSAHRAPHLADGDGKVHLASDPELARKLSEMNGTPAEVLKSAELRQLLFPILRADFELCETYAHEADEPLDCPISALAGLADAQVDRTSLEGWRQHTRAGFESRLFPGDHFFLAQSRSLLIDLLARRLES
jgi:medium-chain acyl-[acyl-carrier-protein] hydrolase